MITCQVGKGPWAGGVRPARLAGPARSSGRAAGHTVTLLDTLVPDQGDEGSKSN